MMVAGMPPQFWLHTAACCMWVNDNDRESWIFSVFYVEMRRVESAWLLFPLFTVTCVVTVLLSVVDMHSVNLIPFLLSPLCHTVAANVIMAMNGSCTSQQIGSDSLTSGVSSLLVMTNILCYFWFLLSVYLSFVVRYCLYDLFMSHMHLCKCLHAV